MYILHEHVGVNRSLTGTLICEDEKDKVAVRGKAQWAQQGRPQCLIAKKPPHRKTNQR